MTDNFEYYQRRAREEAKAAASCASPEAASAHRLLALQYEAQVRDLRGSQPRPKPVLRTS